MLDIKNNDLAALNALWAAVQACNMADTLHLQYQHGGTYGLAHDAFLDAATAVFDSKIARRLSNMLLENGEDVAYQIEWMAQSDICKTCDRFFDEEPAHCGECGACPYKHHNEACYEVQCQGHEPGPYGHTGIIVHCDNSCRRNHRVHTPIS